RHRPVALASGDFNNDSVADLVIATDALGGPNNNLMVLLGQGDGTFQPAPEISAAADPVRLFVSDVNDDGYQDLVVVTGDPTPQVEIWFGRGDGRFSGTYRMRMGMPFTLQVGDFDGDDIPDLAIVTSNDRRVAVYRGLGNGAFQPPQYTDVGGQQA